MIVDEFDYSDDELWAAFNDNAAYCHHIDLSFDHSLYKDAVSEFLQDNDRWMRVIPLMNTHKKSDFPFVATIRSAVPDDLISKAWVAWCAIEKGLE